MVHFKMGQGTRQLISVSHNKINQKRIDTPFIVFWIEVVIEVETEKDGHVANEKPVAFSAKS